MEKNRYIRPAIKLVNIHGEQLLVIQSGIEAQSDGIGSKAYSRESSVWDDDEEEENTGGWFQ